MRILIIAAILAIGLGYQATSDASESEINLLPSVESYDTSEELKLSDLPIELFESFSIQKSTKPRNATEIESQAQDDRDFFYGVGVPFNFIDAI